MVSETENQSIDRAMVLAAGLGTRMRPITDSMPKPLVLVNGKTLLDHALDALVLGGVSRVTVNVHYLADQIEDHLEARSHPAIDISDERQALLDSGGGVKNAMTGLAEGAFFILNADSFWVDGEGSNIKRMRAAWNPEQMDMMLLVSTADQSTGFDGPGDFFMNDLGVLTRRGEAVSAPYIYAGAIVAKAEQFQAIRQDVFSLNTLFDKAIAENRLYGCKLNGLWLHVGTPASIAEAEQAIETDASRQPIRNPTAPS